MSCKEIIVYLKRLQLAKEKGVLDNVRSIRLDHDMLLAIKQGILEEKDGRYALTSGDI